MNNVGSETLIKTISILEKIAIEYSNFLNDGCGALYSSIGISICHENFNFSSGPCTSGLNRYVSLPLSLLDLYHQGVDYKSLLQTLAIQQRQIWQKEIEERVCKHCGSYRFVTTYGSVPAYME